MEERLINANNLIKAIKNDAPNLSSYTKQEAIDCIKAAPTIMNWIPIANRPPRKGERVLLADGWFVGEGYLAENGKYYRASGYLWLISEEPPTHWMPLPNPPKEEKYL